jgi:hypothetical protein
MRRTNGRAAHSVRGRLGGGARRTGCAVAFRILLVGEAAHQAGLPHLALPHHAELYQIVIISGSGCPDGES